MNVLRIRITRRFKYPPPGMRGDLHMKHSHEGNVVTQVKIGTELHRDTNTWQHRVRYINKACPHAEHSYIEKIVNLYTGVIIDKDERLVDHRK